VVVLVFLISSLVCSAYVFLKMLREISEAGGKKGKIPSSAVFGGGLYLLHRYAESVPNGRTALWFVLLIPANVILFGFYLVLGFH
jgi:hypothetical protein